MDPDDIQRRIRALRRDLGLVHEAAAAAASSGGSGSAKAAIARNLARRTAMRQARKKLEKQLDRIPEKWILSVGVVLFLLHTLLTRTALQLLTCKTIVEGGQWYLVEDLSVRCFEEPHSGFVLAVAVPALVLWTAGIPLVVVGLLTLRRDELGTGQLRRSLGFFYSSYKHEYYFNEAVIIARKTLSAVAGVTLQPLGPDMQAFASAAVYVVFRAIHSRTQPYISDTLNHLDELSLDVAVLSLLAGLFLNTGRLGDGVRVLATLFLIAINAVFLAYAVWAGYFEMRERMRRNEAELVKLEKTTGPTGLRWASALNARGGGPVGAGAGAGAGASENDTGRAFGDSNPMAGRPGAENHGNQT